MDETWIPGSFGARYKKKSSQAAEMFLLMFLIYLNELITILENHGIRIKVFAHDVKM